MQKLLSQTDLSSLVAQLNAAGIKVIAPVATSAARVEYKPVETFSEVSLNERLPESPIKQFFLPRTEVLLAYKQTNKGIELTEAPTTAQPQVILCATPCDVAALEVVDKVMNWDYKDELWNGRRAATTIVSLACTMGDKSCFCTAVDLAPDTRRGADVMLTAVDGGFVADVLTEKGEKLLASLPGLPVTPDAQAASSVQAQQARSKVEGNLEYLGAGFSQWLDKQFDNPYWQTVALRCLGCGTCSAVCPTCHCFDMVDEHDNAQEGVRRRNWDTCQSRQFTVHASGHNPRATQNARFRQRVMHKFSIYPAKFEETLCTGCGRCARACPGGMNLAEIVGDLKQQSQSAAEVQS